MTAVTRGWGDMAIFKRILLRTRRIKTIHDRNGNKIGERVVTIEEKGGDWKAAAWILERRFPERWGRNGRRNAQQEKDRFDRWIDNPEEAQGGYHHDNGQIKRNNKLIATC